MPTSDAVSVPSSLGIGAAVKTGTGVIDSLYNIYSGERAFNAQQKQQRFMNDFAMDQYKHGVSTKVADMVSAGLHPSLAAGGGVTTAGGVAASASQPPQAHVNTQGSGAFLERQMMASLMDLQSSQADKNRADAEATRALNPESVRESQTRQALNKASTAKLQSDIEEITARIPTYASTVELQSANTRASKARAFVDELESAYMNRHYMHMPTRQQWIAEVEALIRRIYPELSNRAPGAYEAIKSASISAAADFRSKAQQHSPQNRRYPNIVNEHRYW